MNYSNKLIELHNSNKYSKSFLYIYNEKDYSHLLDKKEIPNSLEYEFLFLFLYLNYIMDI